MIPSASPETLAKCIEALCGPGAPGAATLASASPCTAYRLLARRAKPRPAPVRANIAAIVHSARGETDEAISRLEQSLGAELGQFEFQGLLAEILVRSGRWDSYVRRGELGLEIVAAMKGLTLPPQRYDPSHVGRLFDRFSGEYEERVLREGYAEHTQVARRIATLARGDRPLRVLDLGCGTGMLGEALRAGGTRALLVGVDASEGMLALARERGIYDELHCEDIERFLEAHGRQREIDAAGLASVIPFFGDLRRLMKLLARFSRSESRVVFTYDVAGNEEVQFNRHGRFRHSPSHVQASLADAGLAIEHAEHFVARHESGEPVPCEVVQARAAPNP